MNNTVYISNLSYNRDRNGLKSIFSKFGKIKNIKIVVEPRTNQSRGMAFVEMSSAQEAKQAIESLDQQIIDGRTVKVKYATPLKTAPLKNGFHKASTQKVPSTEERPKNKDLDYTARMLAKKAKNDAKRKSNPFVFKKTQDKRF